MRVSVKYHQFQPFKLIVAFDTIEEVRAFEKLAQIEFADDLLQLCMGQIFKEINRLYDVEELSNETM